MKYILSVPNQPQVRVCDSIVEAIRTLHTIFGDDNLTIKENSGILHVNSSSPFSAIICPVSGEDFTLSQCKPADEFTDPYCYVVRHVPADKRTPYSVHTYNLKRGGLHSGVYFAHEKEANTYYGNICQTHHLAP